MLDRPSVDAGLRAELEGCKPQGTGHVLQKSGSEQEGGDGDYAHNGDA